MKRIGNLYDNLYAYKNLLSAFKKAFRGNKRKVKNSEYYFFLENNLLELHYKLRDEKYKPSKYEYFKIFEPKERTISVADFEDRIVHHALINILEPIFEKTFIFDSYATRKNKGTHKAIAKAQQYLRKYKWYLKIDIQKYFDSIDHQVLINLLERKIKDTKLIKLCKKIIANNDISQKQTHKVGLPIGNLTSQFFANVYLNLFDHFVKENLKLKYIRYMDDMVFFSHDKIEIKNTLLRVDKFITEHLKLKIKPKSIQTNSSSHGLNFLGFRIFPQLIRVKNANIKRLKKKIKKKEYELKTGAINEEALFQSVSSMIEYIKVADSLFLRRKIFEGQKL